MTSPEQRKSGVYIGYMSICAAEQHCQRIEDRMG